AAVPVLAVEHPRDRAVEPVLPAVEAAVELADLAAAVGEPAAAVLADVVEGLQFGLRGPHHDDALVHDVIGDEGADPGQLLLAAGDLPDLGPDARLLEPQEVRRGVVLGGHEIDPDLAPLRGLRLRICDRVHPGAASLTLWFYRTGAAGRAGMPIASG